jgi:hypothetical protein
LIAFGDSLGRAVLCGRRPIKGQFAQRH